jgi:integrase
MGKLTAVAVKNISYADLKGRNRPVRVGDGGGLYLQIARGGSKSWLFRYTLRRKAHEMGLGAYGDHPESVSLSDARRAAEKARHQLAEGRDPLAERALAAAEQRDEQQKQLAKSQRTFRLVSEAYIAAETPGWKNLRTARLWRSSLERHVHPTLGDVAVSDIDRALVKQSIQDVWISAPAIGKKVLHRITAVLRYGAAHGWRTNDNPADAKMLRLAGLPLQKGGKKQPTLPWQRIPYFFNELSRIDGISARALSFLILTALRSSEVRLARWSWLSFEPVPTLTIPGEFMKKRESDPVVSHRVPLAPEVLCVLVKAHYLTTYQQISVADLPNVARQMRDELFFPSPLKNVALSDMSLSAVMRRMNAGSPDEATQHRQCSFWEISPF